ncbi:drug resistance transporter, EmrB/QacA subfamily [Saccharopolyspora shandongensis]|uniref:Drug resistance transporter, EmrB/QacA subfamily n=1 Tax=Saccharopolyspora shandongensis TaxID=418495 RepID=A0A1H3M3P6_9PSEU|nr:MFS transporter [Saccharopolyspora shandongensis]SDY70878.1 drug resistance transporter, EmrB/QacA subfamily [Saccharopolyspora shandongensis]
MNVGESVVSGIRRDPRRWVILSAVCVALTVIVVDNTILNVAIPTIEEQLRASPAELQAVLNSYVVVFAGLLVAAGLIADRYGRRLAVIVGLGTLAATSVTAAFAATALWLIVARTLMGVGAALVMPGTLAILVHVFEPGERVKAFAVWSAVGSAAMAVGPLVGGVLVEQWGWPGIFVINAVLAAAASVLIAWLVPESRDRQHRRIDLVGAAAVTLAMGSFVAAIILAPDHGPLSPAVLACLALAVAGAVVFWVRQRRAQSPMIEMSLYRDRRFAGASVAVAVLAIGTGSVLFILTQHLQHVLEYTPLQAGLAIIPLAIGVVGASPIGERLPGRIGYRRSIMTGFAVTAVGFAVLGMLTPASGYAVISTGLFLAGAGSGLASPAVHTTVLGAVPPDRAGMGSALNDTHQQLGIALGVALIGSIVAAGYRHFAPPTLNVHAGSSLGSTLGELTDQQQNLISAAHLAFTQAQSIAMFICAAFAIAGAVIAWRVLAPDHQKP